MIIRALVENTTISKELKSIHGLSIYIETEKHKILFDLGPGKLLYKNAAKMNISIEDIDTVIISHGHYDHGGALKSFMEKNKKARIYVSKMAFEDYYYKILCFKQYIGLDKTLKNSDRFVFVEDNIVIDEELQIFSNVTEHQFIPTTKQNLLKKEGNQYLVDTFDHEQSLLIHNNNCYTLFAACSHTGIVNILNKAKKITGTDINTCIGGFHLMDLSVKKEENMQYLNRLAGELKQRKTQFYTCHCTGAKVYDILHDLMGEQMSYISTGTTIEL